MISQLSPRKFKDKKLPIWLECTHNGSRIDKLEISTHGTC
jgi:hypothetical protein